MAKDIQITPNVLDFDTLVQETVKQSTKLIEYFRLNMVYYQLISGKGLEFEKIVEYSPGADLRRIDWKKYAKTGKLAIRAFREERKFDVIIIMDVSDTMLLGSTKFTKNQFASIIAGALGFAANDAGDNIAVTMISDKVELATEPSGDYYSMLKVISDQKNYGGHKKWERLMRILPENYDDDSIIFLISDFIDTDPNKFVPELAANFSKVFGIMIRDPLDNELPSGVGKVYLNDPQGRNYLADFNHSKEEYKLLNKKHIKHIKEVFEENDQLFLQMSTDQDFGEAFMNSLGDTEVIIS